MNRKSWTLLLVVAVLSSALWACSVHRDADYYVVTKDDARHLAAEGSTASDASLEITLRVDCRTSDLEGSHDCEEFDITRGMPLVIWRPYTDSLELSTFEFLFDGEVIRDLDGEVMTDVDDVDVFALRMNPQSEWERHSLEKKWLAAGAAVTATGLVVFVGYVVSSGAWIWFP